MVSSNKIFTDLIVDSQTVVRNKTICLVSLNDAELPYSIPPEFLVAQTVKHLPAMREIRVRSLHWEDPLEKEMATHSSILAWKIPWTEEPVRLQSMGSQRVGHD